MSIKCITKSVIFKKLYVATMVIVCFDKVWKFLKAVDVAGQDAGSTKHTQQVEHGHNDSGILNLSIETSI